MSFNRQGVLLMKYSLPPSRKTRRVIVTSLYASSTPDARRFSSSTPPMVSETSAIPKGLRVSVPLKMISAISPPRRALADCSPSTQRIASETFDLPHPLGPTIAVTPGWNVKEVLSAKDLNPRTAKFFRYMLIPKKAELLSQVNRNHNIKDTVNTTAQRMGEEPRLGLCRCTAFYSVFRSTTDFLSANSSRIQLLSTRTFR